MFKTGIQITWPTKIGPGLRISHFGAMGINPGAVIGKNFNVMLAPGAFVNFDVPSESLMIGNPGKIIPQKDASKEYNIYMT